LAALLNKTIIYKKHVEARNCGLNANKDDEKELKILCADFNNNDFGLRISY